MKVTWLGQAGLLFEDDNIRIMVDPYLSDSCRALNENNYRRMPVDEKYFDKTPDVLLITHEHLDHLDPETCRRILETEKSILVLAPYNAWEKIRTYGGTHNYVMFNQGTVWTEKGVRFEAVRAEHSDATAIGVIINAGGKRYYITGDTLFHNSVVREAKGKADIVFLPINGKGNNMNAVDAKAFAEEIGAGIAVPMHWGMFDNISPEMFAFENKVIPEVYKEMRLF